VSGYATATVLLLLPVASAERVVWDLEMKPVRVVPLPATPEAVGLAVRDVLRVRGEEMSPLDFKGEVPRLAGLRGFRPFVHAASSVAINGKGGRILVSPSKRQGLGYLRTRKMPEFQVPSEAPDTDLGQTVLLALQTARAMDGLT
jgi:hypothetical protein